MIPFASCLNFRQEEVLKTKWLLSHPESSEQEIYQILKTRRGLFIKLTESSSDVTSSSLVRDGWVFHSQTGRRLSFSKRYAFFGSRDEAEDRLLLQVLGKKKHSYQHRFYTISRKRRRKPPTRALKKYPSLLDDIYNGTSQCALNRVGDWGFNAFALDSICGGRPITVLCTYLMHQYGLHTVFHFDFVNIWKFFSLIEDGYHSSNPYHNAIHAADVVQAMHCYLQESSIKNNLTDLERLAALIAAVCHDLDHPGVNQHFLVATENHLTVLYNNASVLENHHWRCGMACLWESGLVEKWSTEEVSQLQELIKSFILATDITCQNDFLLQLKNYIETDTIDMKKPECREFCLQIALKCADICNQCRNWEMSRIWASKICDEFYRQGDFERRLGIPVTPLCDRYGNCVANIQTGFIKFVVMPLFEGWNNLLQSPLSKLMLHNLQTNLIKWEKILAEDHEPEESNLESCKADLEHEVRVSSSSMSFSSLEGCCSVIGSLENISQPKQLARRHSLPHSSISTLPRTVIRRESLTDGGQPPVIHETLVVGKIVSEISEHFTESMSPRHKKLYEGCENTRGTHNFSKDRRKSLPSWTKTKSFNVLDPDNIQCLTDVKLPSSVQSKPKLKTVRDMEATLKGKDRKLHRSSSDCPKSENKLEGCRFPNKSRRYSFDSVIKSKNGSDREVVPSTLSRSKTSSSNNGNSNNKENRRCNKYLLKTRLWKSLNQEEETGNIKHILASNKVACKTGGGSAPILLAATVGTTVRRFYEFPLGRRGSAPTYINQKDISHLHSIYNRRGSAPISVTFKEKRSQITEELRNLALSKTSALNQLLPKSSVRRGSLPTFLTDAVQVDVS